MTQTKKRLPSDLLIKWVFGHFIGPIAFVLLFAGCSTNPVSSGQLDVLLAPVAIFAIIIVGALLLIVPIEILLLASVASGVLAASLFTEDNTYYYLRFIPNIVISVRVCMYLSTHRTTRIYLPVPILVPFGLLSIYALISALYSSSPVLSAQRALSMILALIAFGIALPAYLSQSPLQLRQLILWLSLITASAVLLSTLDVVLLANAAQRNLRISGIFGNPNTLGVVALISFFPLLGYWTNIKGSKRIAMTGILVMLIIAVLLSGSRASLLGIAAGFVSMMLFASFNNKSRYRIVFIVLLGLILLFVLFTNPQLLTQSIGRTSDSGRLRLFDFYLSYGLETPLFGHGFNAITGSENFVIYNNNIPYLTDNPFNSYLLLFIGLGTVGLILMIWGFGWIILRSLRTLTKLHHPWFFLCLLAGFIAGLVHALFESWLFAFGNAPTNPYWIFLAILCLYAQYPHLYEAET